MGTKGGLSSHPFFLRSSTDLLTLSSLQGTRYLQQGLRYLLLQGVREGIMVRFSVEGLSAGVKKGRERKRERNEMIGLSPRW